MEKKNNAGAIASNAGDDFHLIWACKKLLDILKPNSELTAVTVEGPTWADSVEILDEDKLYSIDLSEYYGGSNFEQAEHVIYSQLKYSAYQTEKPWTASGLCAKTSKTKDNSIIRRLADTYAGFAAKFESTSEKLTLKLVSNRQLQTDLSASIAEAVCRLKEKKYKRTADLIKSVTLEHKENIQKLYNASNLSSTLFVSFLLILNFDDCGTGIRSIHRAEIIKQLGKWNEGNLRSKYDSLIGYIREQMLPERPVGFSMDKDYVLAALDTSSNELFPAPSKIECLPNDYIERDLRNLILDSIEEKQKIICIQATAGIGKTTFVSHIKDFLPDESVTVLYDCYGGGSFLQESERRHLTGVAIPQICNTLATECGTDWIIGSSALEFQYWRMFELRLANAVFYVKQQNPSAVVVIIVDAADNSMLASNRFKEDCFLNGLLRQSLPEGALLIVTTRTERAQLLPFENDVCVVNLPSFKLAESSKHLRYTFVDADDQQCEDFHLLTDGNPRLQTYLLLQSESVDGVLAQIKPDGKTMDSLFEDFISSVKKQYQELVDVEVLFYAITSLPRPIPVTLLCKLCGISSDMLLSISVECRRGFYIAGSNILLRDEDFETFLGEHYVGSQTTIELIANHMYANRSTDPYCARYIHIFLDDANQFDRLIEIALDERIDDTTIGIAQANQIMKQRIQFALKRSEMKAPVNNLLGCKLVYRLIDYNAREDALNEFLTNAPDEAVLYCDELSVRNTFFTEANDFDSLAKAALVFSHLPAYHDDARQYIKGYLAETKLFFDKPEDKRSIHSKPGTSNIINIAEAMLRLGESKKAVKWLCGWKPILVETKHVFKIFSKLLIYDYTGLSDLLLSQRWASPNKLAIVCAYISLGKEPPEAYVNYLVKLFRRIESIPVNRFSAEQLLVFTEYLFSVGSKGVVTELVDKFSIIRVFSTVPSLYTDDEKQALLYMLRYCALRTACKDERVEPGDFWINKDSSDQRQSVENKQSFTQMIDFLLPLNMFRLNCMQNIPNLFDMCKDEVTKLERQSWSFYSYDKRQLLETGLLVFADAVCLAKVLSPNEFCELTKAILAVCTTSPQFKLKLLDKLTRNKSAFNAALIILGEIDGCYKEYPASAKEMTETYLSCAQMGRRIHAEFGEKYFKKAIACTKDLDYESYRKLYLYKTLAEKVSNTDNDHAELAYNVIRLSEDFCRKMGDTKNFPYSEAIGAAALLSPHSIWGTLCRLDDRDHYDGFSLQDTIPIVLSALLEAGKLSVKDTTALMGLLLPDLSSQYNDLADDVIAKLNTMAPSEQKPILEILTHDILYSIPMDEKEHRSLCMVKYIDANVTDPELKTEKIKEMSNFLQQISKKEPHYSQVKIESSGNIDVSQLLADSKITSQQTLEECLKPLTNTDRNLFVTAWLEGRSPDQYIESLKWLLDIAGSGYYSHGGGSLFETIAKVIASVKDWPQVEIWRNNTQIQQHYLQQFVREFLHLYRGYEDVCNTVLYIFPADSQVQHRAFSNYVANHIDLYDEQLVKAISRMSMSLSTEETKLFLRWTTEIEIQKIHPASGDAQAYSTMKENSETVSSGLSSFIWRLFGHEDKGIRCKASHVLLRATLLGNEDMTKNISELYDKSLPKWYMDGGNYYFIESAKLWYLASCLRITKMSPEHLLSLYSFFKGIACAKGTIHALLRRIAKDICLQLAPVCEPEAIEKLASCDKCIVTNSVTSRPRHLHEDASDTENLKFHFNTMDTLPYWYNHLANIFDCSQADVASECDYFVAEFGITNEKCMGWNKKFLLQEDYGKTYNDHGTIPTVETLEKYAEWHSMFYVADRYRQTKLLTAAGCESYESWLNKYLPGMDGFWCFEFRNHVPLIPFLWDFELTT
ncbi:MAG TPA: hypothetical protein DDZ89_07930, partial [Clostridiales bacterium]|nr:hypothetical protein [Clostridiales bacterium]